MLLGGHKRKSIDEISELYKELSTRIFTQSAIRGTSTLVWCHSYYDTSLWEQMLQVQLGDRYLIKTARDPIAPKVISNSAMYLNNLWDWDDYFNWKFIFQFSAISAVGNHGRTFAYVFRNYTIPIGVESQYMGSHKHKLWEAVRASAAAPSYFEEFLCGDYLHQDGGIFITIFLSSN